MFTTIENRSIVAPDLMTAARYFVDSNAHPLLTPYFISIDHSPSEQLGYDYHTMALVVSQDMEHQKLADELAKELGRETLKQWKKADDRYKNIFHLNFFLVLCKFPVLVVIFHAKESDIIKYESYFICDIGAAGAYKKVTVNGKEIVEIGLFIYEGSKKQETLTVSAKHAPMASYIVSCLLRLHDHLQKAIYESNNLGNGNTCLWMQIWSDRPPNNFDGPYAKVMGVFLGAGRATGKFTWGGFTEDDNQQVDLLADNLAGLFNEVISGKKTYKYKGRPLTPPVTGMFVLEILS